jgi:Fe-coproporphyrin III synthase
MNPLARFAKSVLLTNLGASDQYELNFAITYRCNSRCRTCGIWKRRPKGEMTLNEIRKFAGKLRHIKWMRLTGGEPFLRSDLVEIVRTLNDKVGLYMLSVTTNGTMPQLVAERVERILRFYKSKFTVTVSLDGPRDVHNRIRGVDCYDKALETYRLLRAVKVKSGRRNFHVYFGYTISPFNAGMLKDALAQVQSQIPRVRMKDFHVNVFQTSDLYLGNTKNKGMQRSAAFVRNASRDLDANIKARYLSVSVIDRMEVIYMKGAKKYLATGRTPMQCKVHKASVFVDPFGNVYPCTIYDVMLGNLREHRYDIREIMEGDMSKAAAKEIAAGKCPHCWTPCEAHQTIMSSWIRK